MNTPSEAPRAYRAALCATTTLLCLAGAELAARWGHELGPTSEERLWRYDPDTGWSNRPGFRDVFTSAKSSFRGRVSFDALGVRVNGAPRLEDPALKILMVGDSTTAGLEVDDDKTFAALLEKRLRESGIRANVYNAGVRGFGTDQAYLAMKKLSPVLRPDAVVYMSCGNDFVDNVTIKSWFRSYSKPAFVAEGDALVALNHPAEPMHPELYAFITRSGEGYRVERGFIKKTGPVSWLRRHLALYDRIETAYYVYVSRTPFNVVRRNAAYEKEVFERLVERMRAETGRFFLASFTKAKGGDGVTYDDVKAIAQRRGVPYLDLQPHFKQGVLYDFKTDRHWNEAGHAQAAEAFYQELRKAGVVSSATAARLGKNAGMGPAAASGRRPATGSPPEPPKRIAPAAIPKR
ncbi:MAG: hypothetical protein HY059_18640 [Proteobacteria bacterium]|nr:hypothetical protein [Pseudomonadota bacterium]